MASIEFLLVATALIKLIMRDKSGSASIISPTLYADVLSEQSGNSSIKIRVGSLRGCRREASGRRY